jgi:DNA-binding HxlR family transcriptional regulator
VNAPPTLRRAPIASVQQGLELLSHGLYRDIIKELLEQGPLTRVALTARLHTGSTKLYECLKTLRAAEVVAVSRRGKALEYAVTESGRQLHAATAIVTRWFRAHPGLPLDPSVGWRAFADLGRSWRMVLVEWIVRRAPTEEDVAEGFDGFDEQQLAEILEAMGHADMVELRKGRDGRPRYRLTSWAARAIGILTFLARWEERFRPPGSVAVEVDDAVVAILATLPLVRLPEVATGICTFAAEVEKGQQADPRFGVVWARIRRGRVVDMGEGAPPDLADGWATGTFSSWIAAALDGREGALRHDGRGDAGIELVRSVVAQFHAQLVLYAE